MSTSDSRTTECYVDQLDQVSRTARGIIKGEARAELVIGRQGDGKTAFIRQVARALDDAGYPYLLMSAGVLSHPVPWTDLRADIERRWPDPGEPFALLVDDFDLYLSEELSKRDQWALRELVSERPATSLLGTVTSVEGMSVRDAVPSTSAEDPFFQFFRIRVYRPPSLQRLVEEALPNLAPSRAAAFSRFAGRPADLDALLVAVRVWPDGGTSEDLHTLFRYHEQRIVQKLGALTPQQRQVVLAAGRSWTQVTTRAVAETTGLTKNSSAAQLERLTKAGWFMPTVRFDPKTGETSSKKAYLLRDRILAAFLANRLGSEETRAALFGVGKLIHVQRSYPPPPSGTEQKKGWLSELLKGEPVLDDTIVEELALLLRRGVTVRALLDSAGPSWMALRIAVMTLTDEVSLDSAAILAPELGGLATSLARRLEAAGAPVGEEGTAVNQMVAWFKERHVQPYGNVPYDKETGNYLFMDEAVEPEWILHDHFGPAYPEDWVASAAEILVDEGGQQWLAADDAIFPGG